MVESETPEMLEFRRNIIDMLFAEGNHFCMFCEKSGNCELQALAYRFGITAPRYDYLNPDRDIDLSHPDVYLDRNRCILCGRCVRVSRRSTTRRSSSSSGEATRSGSRSTGPCLADTDLAVSDEAVSACPVGALMPKRVGYAIPVGKRAFDVAPIGTEVNARKGGAA